MGDATADEYHSFGYDVSAHQSAANANEQGADQGILEKVVF